MSKRPGWAHSLVTNDKFGQKKMSYVTRQRAGRGLTETAEPPGHVSQGAGRAVRHQGLEPRTR